jgi:hypothetical protein
MGTAGNRTRDLTYFQNFSAKFQFAAILRVPIVLLAGYLRMTLDLLRLPCLVVLFLCPTFGLGASSCNTPVSQSLVEVPDDFRDIRK